MRSTATVLVAATIVLASGAWPDIAGADPPPPPPGPPPPPATTIDHDGTYAVGTQIVPGNYSSAGPVGDGTCYWKRVSADGQIIDNALTKKPQIVRIDAADASFKTNGCQPWAITDAAPPAGLPPLIAGAQLGGIINSINAGAAQAPPR